MLLLFTVLFFLQLSLSLGSWDKDKIAPGPTDCTNNERLTFCGVTFHCKCIWTMPTFMGTREGCGISPFPHSDIDELHPLWLKPNNDKTLMMSMLQEEEEDNETEEEEEEEEYDIADQDELTPEDPDTEGCGVFKAFSEDEAYMSLRPATLNGVKGSHYLPGNVEAILKIIHKRTGGECRLKQRSARRKPEHCKMGALKPYTEMDLEELGEQEDFTYGIRVGLGRKMKKTVVNAVGQAYTDKYNMANPCYVVKKRREIVCQI